MTGPKPFEATNRDPNWVVPDKILKHGDRFEAQLLKPDETHFWDDTDDYFAQCWMWEGYTDKAGAGFMAVHGRPMPVHKFAWLYWLGDVPSGLFARPELCGVKLCVAPHHLHLRTRKGGTGKVLDKWAIDSIRSLRHDSINPEMGWSHQKLADKFGVSRSTIARVLRETDA
jgi:hypothetical protein